MMIKGSASILGLVLLAGLWLPAPAAAQGNITVMDSAVINNFPLQLTFNIEAASSAVIDDVRLCYNIEHVGFADITSEAKADFRPAARVAASRTLEMVQIGGLPPGGTLEDWWRLRDSDGQVLVTPPASFRFDDTRYTWQVAKRGNINLFWYEGDTGFAGELLDSADAGLAKIKNDTGATLQEPISIYIYASSHDLQGSMIYPQEWTGGVTFTRYGIIAIGVSLDNLAWGKRATVHELAHLVMNQVTSNPYNGLPTWLNEGLAMNTEGTLEPVFSAMLEQAIADDSLISVRSLSAPFSAYSNLSYLSYAQSYSLVNYLITEFGQAKMLALLQTFRQGSTYDGAFQSVYGFDQGGLESRWRAALGAPARDLSQLDASPLLRQLGGVVMAG
jgi:hypothetical protein